jgi:hypothetical protein
MASELEVRPGSKIKCADGHKGDVLIIRIHPGNYTVDGLGGELRS